MQFYSNFDEMYKGQSGFLSDLSVFNDFQEDWDTALKAKYPDLELEFTENRWRYKIKLSEEAEKTTKRLERRLGGTNFYEIFPYILASRWGGFSFEMSVDTYRYALSPDRSTVIIPVEFRYGHGHFDKRMQSYVSLPYNEKMELSWGMSTPEWVKEATLDKCCEVAKQLGIIDEILDSCDKTEAEMKDVRKRLDAGYFTVAASNYPTKLTPTVDTFRTKDYVDVPNPEYDKSYID